MDDPERLSTSAGGPSELSELSSGVQLPGRRRRQRAFVAIGALLVIVGAAVVLAVQLSIPRGEPIFYSAASPAPRDYNLDLFSVASSTGAVRDIVQGSGDDFGLALSPDGDHVAFARVSPDGPKTSIYVASADGTGVTRLTSCCSDYSPIWSPDGKRIAFLRGDFISVSLMVMNVNGSGVRLLCSDQRCGVGLAEPAWSPDGMRIAFSHSNVGFADGALPSLIGVVNADGSGYRSPRFGGCPRSSTSGCRLDRAPRWMPDGRHIVFSRDLQPPASRLHWVWPGTQILETTILTKSSAAFGPETLQATCLAPSCRYDVVARVSPDGRSVLFVSGRKLPGQPEGPRITVVDLVSHRPRVLDVCAGRCQFIGDAVWSPDGRRIAFAASNRYVAPTIPGFPGIAPRYTFVFVVNADGTGIRRMAAGKDISGLDWQPGS